MIKWICIEETSYLTLYNKSGSIYGVSHYVGDIVEVEDGWIYFTDKEDNILYTGPLSEDENNFYGLKEFFIPIAEWRNKQIDLILND